MKMRTWIIDDEPLARELLKSYVERTPFLEYAGQSHSADQFLSQSKSNECDLLLLDIQMPGSLGTKLAEQLEAPLPLIIFSTAYPDYALESYKLNAIDYLLKPYHYNEFLRASHKAWEYFSLLKAKKEEQAEADHFFVRSDHKQIRIEMDKILFIEGMKDYVKIHLEDQTKPVITLMRMKHLEELLGAPQFLRIHRSYIVPTAKIQTMDRTAVSIRTHRIPLSDKMREELEASLGITR